MTYARNVQYLFVILILLFLFGFSCIFLKERKRQTNKDVPKKCLKAKNKQTNK